MIAYLLFFLTRLLLRLRYRIEVAGLQEIKEKIGKDGKGILFLPNHPAHMDPVIVFSLLWPKYRFRPLVVEHIYRAPLLRPFMGLIRALPVPSFDTSVNEMKVRRAQKSIREIADGLKQGKSFILYPSGKLKHTGKESIGGASSAHELIAECPGIDIVLVRTSGLWGSSFSRAIEGRSPELVPTAAKAFLTILRNLIFFSPRRKILVEVESAPADFPRSGGRVELNRYLENWYDRYPDWQGGRVAEEPLQLVSYSRWSRVVPEPYQAKKMARESNGEAIPDKVREKVYGQIRQIMEKPDLPIEEEMNLAFDLGMDSLNIGDLAAFLSHQFDVEEVHPEDLATVRSVLEIASGAQSREPSVDSRSRYRWPEEKERPPETLPLGKTLPEAFLRSCDRLGSLSACADDLVGVLSYAKMKRAALVLSQSFRAIPGKYVGVMLPASCGAYLTILALQCAGKVPVMLNWTLGPRYLKEMMASAQVERAVTSIRFLDRLSHVEFGDLADRFVFLEDVREKISLGQKLKGAFLSLFGADVILKALGLFDIDEESHAVVLFTSGTEAVPKGVPLTHRNIVSNLRSGMQCIEMRPDDVMYGILPPFHSFGFTVAGFFPIFAGMRVAFFPDPTDSFALAEGIERWKATFFCSAPSFLKGLLSAAKEGQLDSIRYFVSGAERLAPELRQKAESMTPNGKVIEGYGITECSPILTISRPNMPPNGAGVLLPDVEACTIHPETLQLLPQGAEGEICVRGPNVFHGYLGKPRDPFIEIQGKKWYRTGDLGYFDKEGTLILSGRLKRFTKIGGEMISLGAVEDSLSVDLIRRGDMTADLPALAICADERVEGRPQLVLFTTLDLSSDEANEILKNAGLSRLIKVASVIKVEEIPLMGSGKTDYRQLQSKIA